MKTTLRVVSGILPAMFFLQELDLFTRHFDLKSKVRKDVLVNRFSLSERSFLIF